MRLVSASKGSPPTAPRWSGSAGLTHSPAVEPAEPRVTPPVEPLHPRHYRRSVLATALVAMLTWSIVGLPYSLFSWSLDPVQLGLVASLSRPGGNVTGVTSLNVEVGPKRLELLHELVPAANVIGLLVNPNNPNAQTLSRDLQVAARKLGLQLHVLHAGNERDFDRVFEALVQLRAGALVIGTDAFLTSHSEQLAALALRHALPAIYQYPEFTAAGGLMSYGGSIMEAFRTAGVYAGRILKGEKPADLPVQQITKVELIINLKTAKALGITVPLPLSGRADEVIE